MWHDPKIGERKENDTNLEDGYGQRYRDEEPPAGRCDAWAPEGCPQHHPRPEVNIALKALQVAQEWMAFRGYVDTENGPVDRDGKPVTFTYALAHYISGQWEKNR